MKKTEERATSFGLLPWCSFVQLPWTQGVGQCDLQFDHSNFYLAAVHGCDVSLSPWGGEICPLCAKPQHRVMPTKPGKDSLRTATAIFNKKCLQFRHWRSSGWSSLAPLLNRLCWPSHFVPAMKWSRRKPVSSSLNLKVAIPDSRGSCETAWSCWICCWKTETCWAWRARRSSQLYPCFYSERTSPTSFLAYIDSPRSLKTKIQKFSLEWIIKHILEI